MNSSSQKPQKARLWAGFQAKPGREITSLSRPFPSGHQRLRFVTSEVGEITALGYHVPGAAKCHQGAVSKQCTHTQAHLPPSHHALHLERRKTGVSLIEFSVVPNPECEVDRIRRYPSSRRRYKRHMMTCGSTIPIPPFTEVWKRRIIRRKWRRDRGEEDHAVQVHSQLEHAAFAQLQTFHALRLRLVVVLPSASPRWRVVATAGATDAWQSIYAQAWPAPQRIQVAHALPCAVCSATSLARACRCQ